MMECTRSGSTLLSWAAFSTISEMLAEGSAWAAAEPFTGATLRTSLPVRWSARTTNALCENAFWEDAFWEDESVSEVFAARTGEAASIMARAVMKQIYTFLFIDMLATIATIISWQAAGAPWQAAAGRGSCWLEAEAPAWARTKRCCHGKEPH